MESSERKVLRAAQAVVAHSRFFESKDIIETEHSNPQKLAWHILERGMTDVEATPKEVLQAFGVMLAIIVANSVLEPALAKRGAQDTDDPTTTREIVREISASAYNVTARAYNSFSRHHRGMLAQAIDAYLGGEDGELSEIFERIHDKECGREDM